MYSDPIADMLTRIRNGLMVYKESVEVPASKFKEQIAELLVREGYLKGLERIEIDGKPFLRLTLKYGPRREKVIQHIRRVSRPGRRVYVSAENVPVVRRGLGTAIISTSKGVLVDREARRLGVGGEVICEVW
ncbi:30S ribosomal protein S8 [Calidithermus timidus]|jgi:small subunit ribosomal protein S8|uniref:30S ribosomal protein S8 n=1 Tax=Calidithermus timidus TaxID=307124 RepID=UPI000363AF23|nr:30S ribosomal protein S8 [Calidithermus timidus]